MSDTTSLVEDDKTNKKAVNTFFAPRSNDVTMTSYSFFSEVSSVCMSDTVRNGANLISLRERASKIT